MTMTTRKANRFLIVFLVFLSGCVSGYEETSAQPKKQAVPGAKFAGIVYGLKNSANQGEIVATFLYADGKTQYAGTVGISCNGKARALLEDSRVNRNKIFLYSVCHRTGVLNGLVVPRRTQPSSRFFLIGDYLGAWNAGLYVDPPNDMTLTPNGRFLFVGGDHGSLLGFRVQRSGSLETIGDLVHPKLSSKTRIMSLGVSAGGSSLVVSLWKDGRTFLRQYRIDRNTGRLRAEGQDISTYGLVQGIVSPDNPSNGNILAGVIQMNNHPASIVVFRVGEAFGTHQLVSRTLSPADGRIYQILFSFSGHSLYVMSDGRARCSGMQGEIRRYLIGEYGKTLIPGSFVCGSTGGSFHNATWDPADRLLISRSVIRVPDESSLSSLRALAGRVWGDHGLVFVPANGEELLQ